jgi:hypothetical protein
MKIQYVLQFSHMDGMQGASEQRAKLYLNTVREQSQVATQQYTIRVSGASGSAGSQANTVRGL